MPQAGISRAFGPLGHPGDWGTTKRALLGKPPPGNPNVHPGQEAGASKTGVPKLELGNERTSRGFRTRGRLGAFNPSG
jgi:hypothetical protein